MAGGKSIVAKGVLALGIGAYALTSNAAQCDPGTVSYCAQLCARFDRGEYEFCTVFIAPPFLWCGCSTGDVVCTHNGECEPFTP
jgi:hypothetical protein